jgi:hypothetical protein
MEDTTPADPARTQTRQPKKRFVGRRTADAQAQTENLSASKDGETTAVQKGEDPKQIHVQASLLTVLS